MFDDDVKQIADQIKLTGTKYSFIIGIPQGGVPAALALSGLLKVPIYDARRKKLPLIGPDKKILIVDDLIDTGTTLEAMWPGIIYNEDSSKYKKYDVAVLCIKRHSPIPKTENTYFARGVKSWVDFWWEPPQNKSPKQHVTRLLQFIGDDPLREGLIETPDRVIRSYKKLFGGYKQHPKDVMKTFMEGSCEDMVILKDISMFSTCEHHILPFYGKAHIAYVPDGKVLGVSKLARLLDIYARRLQIQERIGQQVTQALNEYLNPLGAACIIEAKHFCMSSRGVEQETSNMVTSSLTGVFKDKPEARAELMRLIR